MRFWPAFQRHDREHRLTTMQFEKGVEVPRSSSDEVIDQRACGDHDVIWLVVWNIFQFSIQLAMASSQLTNSNLF